MNTKKYFNKIAVLLLFLTVCVSNSFAQAAKPAAPREEKLLNELRLLIWNQPNAEKVTVRLRVHSGSAFDQQSKEGTMALLGEILFPNETVKEFFREDLGGSLEVTSSYDYIQINATADSDKFLTMLETLARAISNPQIDKETTAKIRAAQIEKIKELEKSPAYLADQAVAKRLFGDFPYGRAQIGTTESLQKIDFADLVLAKQKFLTPDNATVAISGNVKPDFAIRAAKRYFGSWVKADKKVPPTFRQPDAIDEKKLIVESQDKDKVETRQAIRGFARNDKDFFASNILVEIARNRWLASSKVKQNDMFVRQEAHFLPGLIVFGNSYLKSMIQPVLVDLNEDCEIIQVSILFLLVPKITKEEFEQAKTKVLAEMNNRDLADFWLDIDTFKLVSVKDEMAKANNSTLSDAQRISEILQKQSVASVAVKSLGEAKK